MNRKLGMEGHMRRGKKSRVTRGNAAGTCCACVLHFSPGENKGARGSFLFFTPRDSSSFHCTLLYSLSVICLKMCFQPNGASRTRWVKEST